MQKDVKKFEKEQLRLAKKVVTKDDFDKIELVAGVDQSFIDDNKIISAVVVCNYKTLKILEKQYAVVEARFPYISGYLSYRESPAVVEAFGRLKTKPDILMVDAHGICHPRRIGMASHVGLLLDIPTIGIAKSLMCGEVRDGKIYVDGEVRGIEIKTKEFANPIYVSPGHRISLKTAVEIVKDSIKLPHKYPEPLFLAHRYANELKKELAKKVR